MMFEYNMSNQMATEILKARTGSDKKMEPQKYLIKFVNEQMGLMYEVTKVYTTL